MPILLHDLVDHIPTHIGEAAVDVVVVDGGETGSACEDRPYHSQNQQASRLHP